MRTTEHGQADRGEVTEQLWAEDASGTSWFGRRVPTLFWAMDRPRTSVWGAGRVYARAKRMFGAADLVVGRSDGWFLGSITVDIRPEAAPTVVADWSHMPFRDGAFEQAFWDPFYDGRYDPGLREILRVTRFRLLLLHTLIYPQAEGWFKEAMIAITLGPNKRIRCLQVWRRDGS